VADPDGAVAAEMSEQVEHVVNAVFERVVSVGVVVGGTAIAAHVWGDAAEAEGGEAAEKVAASLRSKFTKQPANRFISSVTRECR
jgi:hypothetical protein